MFRLSLAVSLLWIAGIAFAEPLPDAPGADKDLAAPPQVLDGKDEGNGNGSNGNGEKEREHMKDNSFFIEEAYNQEQGVIQHIFNWIGFWQDSPALNAREFDFFYTIEIPLGGEKHQFSFSLPWQQFVEGPPGLLADEQGGFLNLPLNYRYQLFFDDVDGLTPAVAPRFTIILPTGDEDRGLGNGVVGYLFNLPISKTLENFALHFNAGFTYVPDATVLLEGGFFSPGQDLHGYNLGASIIWLASYDFNLLLEWVAFWDAELDDIGLIDRGFTSILNPGFRWAVYTGDEIQFVLGASVPIGLTSDSPDIGAFAYMSVEHRVKKEKQNGGK